MRVGKLQEEQETPERKVLRRSERAEEGEEARLLKRKYHLAESWQDVGSLAIRGGVAQEALFRCSFLKKFFPSK